MRTIPRARLLFALTVAGLLSALSADSAWASPRFNNLMPHGGQRGTEVDIVIDGDNLADAEEILFYDAGIEVVSLTHPEGDAAVKQLKVRFKIAPDCRLGSQRMRVRSRSGVSDLFTFYVGPLPVVEEAEPNTDFTAPQVITNNVSVHGRVDGEDVDYYVVECKQGERLTAEVFGLRLGFSSGGNFFDPYVAILNAERFEIAVSDDAPIAGNDGVASVVVPADGKYIVQIRDASYLGDGKAYYLLNIGGFPRPLGAFPAGGKPGESLSVTFLGDVAGPIQQQVTLPTGVPPQFGVEVTDATGTAPTAQPFRIVNLDNALEVEPNNTAAEATVGPAPGAFNGVMEQPGDIDYFKFAAKAGQVFEVECYGRRLRSAIDPLVYVCNADGTHITGSDDARGPDSYFRFQVPADGDFLIEVRDHLENGGPANIYRVELTPVTPTVVASTLDIRRYVQPRFAIPQGGGCGVIVNVARADFGGPVNFAGLDLPEGVTIECPPDWQDDGQMPVVFYARPDAPVAGKYSTVTAQLADPNQPNLAVSGPLKQDILMVLGQNQVYVWVEEQLKLPLVVVEKSPFNLRVEAPTVPLVQNGSMNLKVIAERAEGFTAPINISLLINPPGCGSAGSVQIAEGQTEALISINAASNAPPQTSMICVKGTSRTEEGREANCSPFIPITVEEQYVTFEFAQSAVEQGKETLMPIKVIKRKDYEGEAEVQLLGLPANTTAAPIKLTKDMTEVMFTVKAAAEAPVSDNRNLFCQVLIPEAGVTVLHNLGTGRLRIDPPPPKPAEPAPTPEATPMPVAEAAPVARPLSRLEQLREDQKKRATAAGGQ
ncbi:MAG: PPC domain-containing protein [Planctomycetaceae bacterium]|nr:PPC domain-containing protein [Planctomycetaceae bacterium]